MKHVNLDDVVRANNLLMQLGADDALPKLASIAIERSLELQSRIDRALDYSHSPNAHNSPHVRQLARILDGSITLEDERAEMIPEPLSPGERPSYEQVKVVPAPARPVQRGRLMADRGTKERKAFREWAAQQGFDLPMNMRVPQHYLDAFDEATGLQHAPKPQQRKRDKSPRGKLRPGHGLAGRSMREREELRQWLMEQGFGINPTGRIPQKYIDTYDEAMEELRRMRTQQQTNHHLQQQPEQQDEGQQGEQHAS